MNLQGIGSVTSQPAINIKEGDTLVWNYDARNVVEAITKETAKFITVSLRAEDGNLYSRRLKKDREVCIV